MVATFSTFCGPTVRYTLLGRPLDSVLTILGRPGALAVAGSTSGMPANFEAPVCYLAYRRDVRFVRRSGTCRALLIETSGLPSTALASKRTVPSPVVSVALSFARFKTPRCKQSISRNSPISLHRCVVAPLSKHQSRAGAHTCKHTLFARFSLLLLLFLLRHSAVL